MMQTISSKNEHGTFWRNEKGELHRVDGPAIEWASGTKFWYINGKCHRADGPAIEWKDGSKHWYLNGELHRTDGPAIEFSNGSCMWYVNGKLHRVDGPAIIYGGEIPLRAPSGIEFALNGIIGKKTA